MSAQPDLQPKARGFDVERDLPKFPASKPINIDLTGRPVVAALYMISAAAMNSLGPMLWAALILLFLYAEVFT